MKLLRSKPCLSFCLVSLGLGTAIMSCQSRGHNESSVETTHIPVTSIKRQSVGNCWIYAAVGWMEAMVIADKQSPQTNMRNISESYYLYRHYETQLKQAAQFNADFPSELSTGGFWHGMAQLIREYGVLEDKNFIKDEQYDRMSATQAAAEAYLNTSLKSGRLSREKTAAAIDEELDAAFKVKRADFEPKIVKADKFIIRHDGAKEITLTEELTHWKETYLYLPKPTGTLPKAAELTSNAKRLIAEAKDHLNQNQPILVTWWVDFNANSSKGIFGMETFLKNGAGHSGLHMTMAVDYLAHGKTPAGVEFKTPEGASDQTMRDNALQYGELDALIVKNSWGKKRSDRGAYAYRGINQGYQRLESDYLFAYLPTSAEAKKEGFGNDMQVIKSFILPDYGMSEMGKAIVKGIQ